MAGSLGRRLWTGSALPYLKQLGWIELEMRKTHLNIALVEKDHLFGYLFDIEILDLVPGIGRLVAYLGAKNTFFAFNGRQSFMDNVCTEIIDQR